MPPRSAPVDPATLLPGLRKGLDGPHSLTGDGDEPLFPKGAAGKKLAEGAVAQGFLVVRKVEERVGKKTKTVEVGELTEKGRQYVLDADSPKAILEALLPAVKALTEGKTSGPNPDVFRAEVEKATKTCLAAIESAFQKLEMSLQSAFQKMAESVATAVPANQANPPANAAPVLAALQSALGRLPPNRFGNDKPTPPPAPKSVGKDDPTCTFSGGPALSASDLRGKLREAYNELCLYREFQDGLVEIPRLYHEVIRRVPGLAVERFHQELEALSKERKIELHKLNEVHEAKERHLAIERDDRLYYYLLWE